jgi:hypothetical protein
MAALRQFSSGGKSPTKMRESLAEKTEKPIKRLGNALKMTRLDARLGHQQRVKNIAPSAALSAAKPKQAATLKRQETLAQKMYLESRKAVTKLEATRKKKGLTKAGRNKLSEAIDKQMAALQKLNSVREAIKALNEEFTPAANEVADGAMELAEQLSAPTAMDYADAALAQAELTEGLTDDLDAHKKILTLQESAYAEALASGDPRKISEAARNLKTARDNVKTIEGELVPSLPSVLTFGPLGPSTGTLAGVAEHGSNIQVIQNFTRPAEDEYSLMKQAQFAAGAAFGG